MINWIHTLFRLALCSVSVNNIVSSSTVQIRKIVMPKYNVPVYSLVTINDMDFKSNMNIITYANGVGLRPSLVWSISLYKKTKSYENFQSNGIALLQQLDMDRHVETISILGKQSGYDINKFKLLEELKISICEVNLCDLYPGHSELIKNGIISTKISVLKDSINVLILKRRSDQEVIDAGDHEVFFCEVVSNYLYIVLVL